MSWNCGDLLSHSLSWRRFNARSIFRVPKPTDYGRMLVEFEDIKLVNSILAAIFSWLLLAGYLVFPGTFATLQSSEGLRSATAGSNAGLYVYKGIQNLSLLWVAAILCAGGLCGEIWLCWRCQHNIVWLNRKIF